MGNCFPLELKLSQQWYSTRASRNAPRGASELRRFRNLSTCIEIPPDPQASFSQAYFCSIPLPLPAALATSVGETGALSVRLACLSAERALPCPTPPSSSSEWPPPRHKSQQARCSDSARQSYATVCHAGGASAKRIHRKSACTGLRLALHGGGGSGGVSYPFHLPSPACPMLHTEGEEDVQNVAHQNFKLQKTSRNLRNLINTLKKFKSTPQSLTRLEENSY